jgi:hypothetical protein
VRPPGVARRSRQMADRGGRSLLLGRDRDRPFRAVPLEHLADDEEGAHDGDADEEQEVSGGRHHQHWQSPFSSHIPAPGAPCRDLDHQRDQDLYLGIDAVALGLTSTAMAAGASRWRASMTGVGEIRHPSAARERVPQARGKVQPPLFFARVARHFRPDGHPRSPAPSSLTHVNASFAAAAMMIILPTERETL